MQSANRPAKFPIPWAASAGTATIRPIPVVSQIGIQAGAASLTDGFPPLNLVDVNAGGVPPFGQDMNGILNQITSWDRWLSAGGSVQFDPAFASAIGGYPLGSLLLSTSGHAVFESLAENNSSDPNSGDPSWRVQSSVWSASTWAASGSSNAQSISLSPAPTSLAQMRGIPFFATSSGTNTGAVTINPNGLGAVPVTLAGGAALLGYELVSGSPFQIIYNGSSFVIVSATNSRLPFSVVQAFTSTGTFIPPPGVFRARYRMWGGGAAGGGGNASGAFGGGGGGGGYAEGIAAVTPGTPYSIFVGTGGAGSIGIGGNGVASVFGSVSAGGGVGGAYAATAGAFAGGAAGTATGGDVNLPGGPGSYGYQAGTTVVAAAGGWAFGTSISPPAVGTGGGGVNGTVGAFPGGGGSGGAGVAVGGAGANGLVILIY